MIFAGTFISGFSKIIKKLLYNQDYDIKIFNIYDGFVIFKTEEFEKILNIPFFNNVYLLIGRDKLISKNFKDFYYKMLKEMERVLKKDGKVIILMGNNEDFSYSLQKSNFTIEDKLNILVNGKKATIYKLIVK